MRSAPLRDRLILWRWYLWPPYHLRLSDPPLKGGWPYAPGPSIRPSIRRLFAFGIPFQGLYPAARQRFNVRLSLLGCARNGSHLYASIVIGMASFGECSPLPVVRLIPQASTCTLTPLYSFPKKPLFPIRLPLSKSHPRKITSAFDAYDSSWTMTLIPAARPCM